MQAILETYSIKLEDIWIFLIELAQSWMEKDDIDIRNLREWQPLDDVLQQIPANVRRGFFLHDLNVTCIDVVPEFLALGTDAGIIFWYDRINGSTQKLRSEVSNSRLWQSALKSRLI